MKQTNRFSIQRIALYPLVMVLCSGCLQSVNNFLNEAKTTFRTLQSIRKGELSIAHTEEDFFGEEEKDFIPLNDRDLSIHLVDYPIPQPKEVPGIIGGKIPGITAFRLPSPSEAQIFHKIYFATDQYAPKGKEMLGVLHRIANYLKKHPDLYVFIEGHADERASEAYNLALGTRRANYIRKSLVKSGVNPHQLYTISYGKEKPEAVGHGEKFWSKNRRVSFKLYEKKER